jgi:hypothetical protein
VGKIKSWLVIKLPCCALALQIHGLYRPNKNSIDIDWHWDESIKCLKRSLCVYWPVIFVQTCVFELSLFVRNPQQFTQWSCVQVAWQIWLATKLFFLPYIYARQSTKLLSLIFLSNEPLSLGSIFFCTTDGWRWREQDVYNFSHKSMWYIYILIHWPLRLTQKVKCWMLHCPTFCLGKSNDWLQRVMSLFV